MEMIICNPDKEECALIERYVRDYCRDKGVQIRSCGEWQELYECIRQKEADVIIISVKGVAGLDIITGLKIQTGKLIWFSDLDFAIQAYRMNIPYFNLLPVTQEKISHALHEIQTAGSM